MSTLVRILTIIIVLVGVYFITRDKSTVNLPSDSSSAQQNDILTTETDESEPLTPSAEGDASIILNEDQGSSSGSALTKDITLPQENATWTVSYTNTGFFPKTITIKKGDTVRFANNSDDDMWVASNPHPIHSDLNGFDSEKSYESNSIFTYTFTKTGTWSYHNHKNSSVEGTIIVK
jgi:plastocyanin